MPLLAFTDEIQKLVPLALAILYVIGHVAGLFGKKKPDESEIEVEVEVEEEPARPRTAPPPVPPPVARTPTPQPAPKPPARPVPVEFPEQAPRPVHTQRLPDLAPPRVPQQVRNRRERRERQKPPILRVPPAQPVPAEVADAYAHGGRRTDESRRSGRIQFGEPTPDAARQPGKAARARLRALLGDRESLQTSVLISEILGKPLAEREPRF